MYFGLILMVPFFPLLFISVADAESKKGEIRLFSVRKLVLSTSATLFVFFASDFFLRNDEDDAGSQHDDRGNQSRIHKRLRCPSQCGD